VIGFILFQNLIRIFRQGEQESKKFRRIWNILVLCGFQVVWNKSGNFLWWKKC